MDIQLIIVGLLFAAALVYMGRIVYRMFKPKAGTGCGSNCNCGADFSKIAKAAESSSR